MEQNEEFQELKDSQRQSVMGEKKQIKINLVILQQVPERREERKEEKRERMGIEITMEFIVRKKIREDDKDQEE